jgi:Mrp family chromosome partitioning ATPase
LDPRKSRTVLVTSTNPDEGKSFIAQHLAAATGGLGDEIVLVSADLRRPSLAASLKAPADAPGLAELLDAADRRGRDSSDEELGAQVADFLLDSGMPGVRFLPTGQATARSADALGTRAFAAVLDALKREAETVVLDSAPILTAADALSMARQVDLVVLVVAVGSVSHRHLAEAQQLLAPVARAVAVIANRVPSRDTDFGQAYGPMPEAKVLAARTRDDAPLRL